eukprot:scaffold31988_cov67-Phaeocystis_antarctica.AAC.4
MVTVTSTRRASIPYRGSAKDQGYKGRKRVLNCIQVHLEKWASNNQFKVLRWSGLRCLVTHPSALSAPV